MAAELKPDEWFFIQRHDDLGDMCRHPKYLRHLFRSEDLQLPGTYSGMMSWVQMHILEYMNKMLVWKTGCAYPRRTAYLWGPSGVGRTTYLIAEAKRSKINFLYVPCYFHTLPRIRSAIVRAKDMAPCILYFSDAEGMLSDENAIRYLHTCLSADLERYDPVWVLFGGVTNPMSFPQAARVLIENNGDIVVISPPSSIDHNDFVVHMMRILSGDTDYPPTDMSAEWTNTVSELTRCANHCTFGEVSRGLNAMFQQFRATSLKGNPPPSFIQSFLQTLPVTSDQPQKRVFFSDAQARFIAFLEAKKHYPQRIIKMTSDSTISTTLIPTPSRTLVVSKGSPPQTVPLKKRSSPTKPDKKILATKQRRRNAFELHAKPPTLTTTTTFLEP